MLFLRSLLLRLTLKKKTCCFGKRIVQCNGKKVFSCMYYMYLCGIYVYLRLHWLKSKRNYYFNENWFFEKVFSDIFRLVVNRWWCFTYRLQMHTVLYSKCNVTISESSSGKNAVEKSASVENRHIHKPDERK